MTESIFSPTRPTEENSFFTENSEMELYKGSLLLNQMKKSKEVFVSLTTKRLKIFRDEKDMAVSTIKIIRRTKLSKWFKKKQLCITKFLETG